LLGFLSAQHALADGNLDIRDGDPRHHWAKAASNLTLVGGDERIDHGVRGKLRWRRILA
jgi:hypothetical protein